MEGTNHGVEFLYKPRGKVNLLVSHPPALARFIPLSFFLGSAHGVHYRLGNFQIGNVLRWGRDPEPRRSLSLSLAPAKQHSRVARFMEVDCEKSLLGGLGGLGV